MPHDEHCLWMSEVGIVSTPNFENNNEFGENFAISLKLNQKQNFTV